MNSITLAAADPCDEFLGTPSQELRSATWRAREESVRGGPTSPINRIREVLGICLDDFRCALQQDALPPTVDDLSIAVRNNKELFDAALLLGQRTESAALSAWEAMRAPSYFPRSAGASRGDEDSLTEADLADFARFADYAARVGFQLMGDAADSGSQAHFDASRIPSEAAIRVSLSAVEASLFTFLRQRLPGIFYHGEWDAGATPKEMERGLERKQRLFAQLVQFAAERVEKLKREMEINSSVRSNKHRLFALTYLFDQWSAIQRSLSLYNNLQLLTELHKVPKATKRLPVPSVWPYPLLRTCSTSIGPPQHCPELISLHASSTDRYFWLTHVTVDRVWQRRIGPQTGKSQTIRALACQPQPGGPSSLSRNSFIPLKRFTHPEDPAVLRADAMARRSDEYAAAMADAFRQLDLLPEEILALSGHPRIQLVIRAARRKRVWGLLGDVPCYYSYLLMAPQDAKALGFRRARPLPASERRHLAYADAPVDDDARVVWWATDSRDGDDDGGGGDTPPSPPPDPPEARKRDPQKPELVPAH